MTSALYRSGQAQFALDADSGLYKARVELGPTANYESWVINRLQVFTTNDPTVTTFHSKCRVFRDFVGGSGYIDGTQSGDANSSEANNITLGTFQKLIFVWEATDISFLSIIATAVVQGGLS